MCGIAGAFEPGRTAESLSAAASAMADAMRHRGPDGHGVFSRPGVAFSHRRLSLIDLSDDGRQPMSNPAETLWVTFNGEIYNYKGLRAELQSRGYQFRSMTDTEVLLHGYDLWGMEGLLRRLRGMFAFALWDGRGETPRLFLARDRFGIKPLYYSSLPNGGVVFASEVRALTAGGLVPEMDDPRAWLSFLVFGSVPHPLTTVRGVSPLPPAHYLETTVDGANLRRYYTLPRAFDRRKTLSLKAAGTAMERLRACYEETVRLHLISDAPLGVFLSGGLDSTALVALAAQSKPDLRTVSVVFHEDGYSEQDHQRLVALRYRTDHREAHVRREDFQACVADFLAAMDQPTVDGMNTYLVARAARDAGLKAVLSGIGADELFGGYATLAREQSVRRLHRLPRLLRSQFHRFGALKASWDRLAYLKGEGVLPVYLTQRGLFSPQEAAKVLGASEQQVWDLLTDLEQAGPGAWAEQQDMEFHHYLRDQLLKDGDVLGMAHSIEIRVPFLDHILAEAVLETPVFVDSEFNKPRLSETLRGLLPESVVSRAKHGFAVPVGAWLSREAGETGVRGHWSRPWAVAVMKSFKERRSAHAAGPVH